MIVYLKKIHLAFFLLNDECQYSIGFLTFLVNDVNLVASQCSEESLGVWGEQS